ncbi:MAG: Secretion system C-terminal sorting domain [Flavipsychrobacter sp.]|nr:Secretion system C-terminal sorting domain [Flavipsychrobacter sp.]
MKYVLFASFVFLTGLSYAQQPAPTGGNFCIGEILDITPSAFSSVLENGKNYSITVDLFCEYDNSSGDIIIKLDWKQIGKMHITDLYTPGPFTIALDKINMPWGPHKLYYDFTGFYHYPGYKYIASMDVTVSGVTRIEDINDNGDITVFPVPANDVINIIQAKTANKIEQVSIINPLGREVKTLQPLLYNSEIQIPVDELANGTYILQLRTNNGNFNKRIAVMH